MKMKIIASAMILASTVLSVQAATDTKMSSGYFVASNKTDRSVTIRVGNFIPSSYTLAPHSSKTVIVSSSNQNIEISEIS